MRRFFLCLTLPSPKERVPNKKKFFKSSPLERIIHRYLLFNDVHEGSAVKVRQKSLPFQEEI